MHNLPHDTLQVGDSHGFAYSPKKRGKDFRREETGGWGVTIMALLFAANGAYSHFLSRVSSLAFKRNCITRNYRASGVVALRSRVNHFDWIQKLRVAKWRPYENASDNWSIVQGWSIACIADHALPTMRFTTIPSPRFTRYKIDRYSIEKKFLRGSENGHEIWVNSCR